MVNKCSYELQKVLLKRIKPSSTKLETFHMDCCCTMDPFRYFRIRCLIHTLGFYTFSCNFLILKIVLNKVVNLSVVRTPLSNTPTPPLHLYTFSNKTLFQNHEKKLYNPICQAVRAFDLIPRLRSKLKYQL